MKEKFVVRFRSKVFPIFPEHPEYSGDQYKDDIGTSVTLRYGNNCKNSVMKANKKNRICVNSVVKPEKGSGKSFIQSLITVLPAKQINTPHRNGTFRCIHRTRSLGFQPCVKTNTRYINNSDDEIRLIRQRVSEERLALTIGLQRRREEKLMMVMRRKNLLEQTIRERIEASMRRHTCPTLAHTPVNKHLRRMVSLRPSQSFVVRCSTPNGLFVRRKSMPRVSLEKTCGNSHEPLTTNCNNTEVMVDSARCPVVCSDTATAFELQPCVASTETGKRNTVTFEQNRTPEGSRSVLGIVRWTKTNGRHSASSFGHTTRGSGKVEGLETTKDCCERQEKTTELIGLRQPRLLRKIKRKHSVFVMTPTRTCQHKKTHSVSPKKSKLGSTKRKKLSLPHQSHKKSMISTMHSVDLSATSQPNPTSNTINKSSVKDETMTLVSAEKGNRKRCTSSHTLLPPHLSSSPTKRAFWQLRKINNKQIECTSGLDRGTACPPKAGVVVPASGQGNPPSEGYNQETRSLSQVRKVAYAGSLNRLTYQPMKGDSVSGLLTREALQLLDDVIVETLDRLVLHAHYNQPEYDNSSHKRRHQQILHDGRDNCLPTANPRRKENEALIPNQRTCTSVKFSENGDNDGIHCTDSVCDSLEKTVQDCKERDERRARRQRVENIMARIKSVRQTSEEDLASDDPVASHCPLLPTKCTRSSIHSDCPLLTSSLSQEHLDGITGQLLTAGDKYKPSNWKEPLYIRNDAVQVRQPLLSSASAQVIKLVEQAEGSSGNKTAVVQQRTVDVVSKLLASGRLDRNSRAATILRNIACGRSLIEGLGTRQLPTVEEHIERGMTNTVGQ